jgi:polysaccharide biosynthesis protein PslJ
MSRVIVGGIPAVAFVIIYLFLRFCIPSQLIVGPLGAAGTPANLWGICALLWWIAATMGGQNPVRGWTPVRVAFGLFVVTVLSSYIAGNATGWYAPASVHQRTDELWTLVMIQPTDVNAKTISSADRGLLSLAGWAGILLLTAEGMRTWEDLNLLCTWITRFAAFVAGIGIIQYFTGIDIASLFTIPGLSANSDFGAVTSRSILNRVSSTAAHPIEFGVVMAGALLIALHRSIEVKRSLAGWIPTLLIGLALPMSVSRSAVLAVGLGLIMLFVGWPTSRRLWALAIAPFAIVGMRLLAPGLLGTIRSLFTNLFTDPSITGRTSDYAVVWALYADNPLFGRGLYTFMPRYYRILDNQFLGSLLELGAVGLTLLVIFLLTVVWAARSARRRARRDRDKHLSLVLSSAVISMVFSYATFDALGYPMVTGLSFVLFGMSGAAWQLASSENPAAQPPIKVESPGQTAPTVHRKNV